MATSHLQRRKISAGRALWDWGAKNGCSGGDSLPLSFLFQRHRFCVLRQARLWTPGPLNCAAAQQTLLQGMKHDMSWVSSWAPQPLDKAAAQHKVLHSRPHFNLMLQSCTSWGPCAVADVSLLTAVMWLRL